MKMNRLIGCVFAALTFTSNVVFSASSPFTLNVGKVGGLEWPAIDPAFQHAVPVREVSSVNEPQVESQTISSIEFKTFAEAESSLSKHTENLEALIEAAEAKRQGKFIDARYVGPDEKVENRIPLSIRFDTYGGYIPQSIERLRTGILTIYEKNQPKAYIWEISFQWKYNRTRKTLSYLAKGNEDTGRITFEVSNPDIPTNVYKLVEDRRNRYIDNDEDRFILSVGSEFLLALRSSALFVNHPEIKEEDLPLYAQMFLSRPFDALRGQMKSAFMRVQDYKDKPLYANLALFVIAASANLYQDAKLGSKKDVTDVLLEAKRLWQKTHDLTTSDEFTFSETELQKLKTSKYFEEFLRVWNHFK